MIRVMVTGAGGFLGATLARRFAARDDVELIALGRAEPPPFARAGVLDLHDKPAIAGALADIRPDVVVHAAGRTPGKPGALLADNAVATANLAEAIGEAATGAGLVLLGSAAQYGIPDELTPWKESRSLLAVRALRPFQARRRDRGLRGRAPAGLRGDGAAHLQRRGA